MPAESVSARAECLFEHGQDADLLAFAATNWPGPGLPLTADHAELARFARVAAYRCYPSVPESTRALMDLWQARAIAAASASRALRSAALSLQPHFFALVGASRFLDARAVLEEMLRLIELRKHRGPPIEKLARRIHAERMALSFTEEGRWDDAISWYEKSAGYCRPGSRAALKVEGGRIRAVWLAGGSAVDAANAFEAVWSASSQYPDVHDAAEKNLAAARAEDSTCSCSFDRL